MAAGAWVFTDTARGKVIDGTLKLGDTYKMALFKSTSDLGAASTDFASVTNEVDTGGYAAGGIAITLTKSGTTTVTVDIQTDPEWTVSSTSLVARFACIYEVGGDVLSYCLLDSTPADVTVTVGNKLCVAASASGVYTLA
jgi:hypothetical protein